MLNKIFGQNKEMLDMTVIWNDDVAMDDLMDDLNRIGQYMCRPAAFKKGSRIVMVRNWFINDRMVKEAELYVDKETEKLIADDVRNGKFKAATGTSTVVG